jgi:hypothetical protein
LWNAFQQLIFCPQGIILGPDVDPSALVDTNVSHWVGSKTDFDISKKLSDERMIFDCGCLLFVAAFVLAIIRAVCGIYRCRADIWYLQLSVGAMSMWE